MEVIIDGKTYPCEKGEVLLEVARRNNIFIPALCECKADSALRPCGVCIVEVEIEGESEIVTSCNYRLEQSCIVHTNSDNVIRERKTVLTSLREENPDSSEIAQLAEFYHAPTLKSLKRLERKKCVLCGRCVEVCASLGIEAVTMDEQGSENKLVTPFDEPTRGCIGCGSCAAMCPTSFIDCEQDDSAGTRVIWGKTFTLVPCIKCGRLIDTEQQHQYIRARPEKFGDDSKTLDLCDVCKKRAVSDSLSEVPFA